MLAVLALVVAAVAVPAAARTARAQTSPAACGGRALLACQAKTLIYQDEFESVRAAVLEAELFEVHVRLPLANPRLAGFWRFESAVAATRSLIEQLMIDQGADSSFESVVAAPRPRPIRLRPLGIVTRPLAGALGSEMTLERAELRYLDATLISLDRATAASYLAGRQDWVAYQEQTAARYARAAAAAIARLIPARRRLAALLHQRHLLYGVGPVDLTAAQRRVRRQGLSAPLARELAALSFGSPVAGFWRSLIERADLPLSYGLSELLADPSTVAGERDLRSGLLRFAAAAPSHLRKPQ